MPAKLVVTATAKGSRIALLGSSGKQLLASAVFTEPRAKGATLRALRGLLGDDVTVEDNTTVASARKGSPAPVNGSVTAVKPAATQKPRSRKVRRVATSNGAPRKTAAAAKRARRRVAKN